jgi:hypothetical protein
MGDFLSLYLAPGEGMAGIVARKRFLGALLALVAVNLVFTGIWLQKVEPRQFLKAQLEQSGRLESIPPDRREEVLESQSRFFPIMAWTSAVLGAPIFLLVLASLYLFIFRFFYAAELDFRQSLSVSAHGFLAVSLVTSLLTLVTLTLKGDWNVAPQEALQANLSLLLERDGAPAWLFSLAGSIDLFSFWTLALLSIGFGVATRRSAGSALWGVAAPWLVYVAGKVALAGLM